MCVTHPAPHGARLGSPRRPAPGPRMTRVPPVPQAWKNLAHDPVRFGLFASGIGFAVVLMGVQLGIMNAMLDGNTRLFRSIDAELVLLNPGRPALVFADTFSR